MTIVASEAKADDIFATLSEAGETVFRIGRIEPRADEAVVFADTL